MKTSTRIAICLVLMMALGAGGLQAQDEKDWSVSFDNAFTSKYIWRGQNLSNTASMQPGMTFGYKGLSVSSWSNFAHTAFGESGVAGNHWTEHDLTVDYGFALTDKVSVNAGYINYAFPNFNDGRYSNEVYGGVSVDTILQPSFAVYGDMHNGNGMYYLNYAQIRRSQRRWSCGGRGSRVQSVI